MGMKKQEVTRLAIAAKASEAFVAAVFVGTLIAQTGCVAQNFLPEVWSHYGGDPGGSRYSHLSQIDRDNVANLQVAWTYSTGEAEHEEGTDRSGACSRCHSSDANFEATPIYAAGRLYLSTPLNRAIALDPETGAEIWRYDPHIKLDIGRSEGFTSRGVSYWAASSATGAVCVRRVFLATVDARLISLDAETGLPCREFGSDGVVALDVGVGDVDEGQYGVTSPPAVVGDVVIIGSAIGDNRRVDLEHGTVRGYDARTGELAWSWDPIPRGPDDPGWDTWTPDAARRTGGANAWSAISADPERDMVFLPLGASAPDFYGGERIGANLFANSVVALRASTGEYLWHFQVVHHDLWDYDLAAQPALVTVSREGRDVDAVVVAGKTGHVFVLDRETGEPLFPVEERPVPPSDVPGEEAWPTQPFPVLPPPLHPQSIAMEDAWGVTPEEEAYCKQQFEQYRLGEIFTPPSLEGTLMFPGFAGGVNWGSVAIDRERKILVTNVFRMAMWVRLHPRAPGSTGGNQRGTPYTMTRAPLLSPTGLPCNKPPWGTLVAVNLVSGEIEWEIPFGGIPDLVEVPGSENWGSPSFGGPMITAGGLIFIAAAMDDFIRAFDIETGEEVWKASLPAGGQATPMTYEVAGKQYIVIAAGGHGNLGTTLGDYVVAFALK
jgi:quinoprotein glucose dehydrogenase